MRLQDLAHGKTGLIGFGREGQALEKEVLKRIPAAQVEVIAERPGELKPLVWPLKIQPLSDAKLDFDRLIRSPGVPVDHPALVDARSQGVEVTTSSSLWFAERSDARTIVVTGSKGKSTTTALIAHLLNQRGLSVAMAGNIGIPLIGLIDATADWFVLELSSYQLVDLQAAPEIGVITRLFPEHLDWHGSVERYYGAKLRLLDMLNGGALWINANDAVLKQAVGQYSGLNLANHTSGGIYAQDDGLYRNDQRALARQDWPLAGKHNLDNLAVALSVVTSLGFEFAQLVQSAKTFQPLPHRLQQVYDCEGRCWINDSISTSPYATQAALESCGDDVVLIVGGQNRPADWSELIKQLRANVNKKLLAGVVGLPENGARIAQALVASGLVDAARVSLAADMSAAVQAARSLAGADSQVLLSPGAPSFSHYRDFEDRGNQFMQAVLSHRIS